MNPQIQKNDVKLNVKKILLVSLAAIIVILIAATSQIAYMSTKYDKIHKDVTVNGHKVAGMTQKQLEEFLKTTYSKKAEDTSLKLKLFNIEKKITFKELGITYDIVKVSKQAYDIGRNESLLKNAMSIVTSNRTNKNISLSFNFDKTSIQNLIDFLNQNIPKSKKDHELVISRDKVIIRSGHKGMSVDEPKLIDAFKSHINKSLSDEIEVPVMSSTPSKINIDEYFNKINTEAQNASIKIQNNKTVIIPHVIGRKVDINKLTLIVNDIEKTEDLEKEVYVSYTNPKILTENISQKLFNDVLSSFSTRFSTSNVNDANRGHNIRLASAILNGKVLNSGETFSFNKVVGPRTVTEGYKIAHVYSEGKVIDDFGGGICQVSTTLYNSILKADLQVLERTNHMFTVGYVPYGLDAAVSYGNVDLKFKNNTNWPIKLESYVNSSNTLSFIIKGTVEELGKSIELSTNILQTINFSTKYEDDSSLAVGSTNTVTNGMTGYIVDSFKILKKNGIVVSKSKLATSKYSPLDRQIKRGIKVTSTPQEQLKATPATATIPSNKPQTTPSIEPSINSSVQPTSENFSEPVTTTPDIPQETTRPLETQNTVDTTTNPNIPIQ